MKRKRSEEIQYPKKRQKVRSMTLNKVSSDTFWCIMDDLKAEFVGSKGFYVNRKSILLSFKDDTMYGITDYDLDWMLKRRPKGAGEPYGIYHVPGFICYNPKYPRNTILWVRKDYRGNGYGSFLVNELAITQVSPLEESILFWERIGFTTVDNKDDSNCVTMIKK